MYVPHERRARILRLLSERGVLRTADLAEELGVTDETVRTDLILLQKERLLKRIHGGAIYQPPQGGFCDHWRADARLLSHILPWIKERETVYADACPLFLALVEHLQQRECCVLTPSLDMVVALAAPAMKGDVVLPGGKLQKCEGIIDPGTDGAEKLFSEYKLNVALLCPNARGKAAGQIAYKTELQAQWAAAAAKMAQHTLIVFPTIPQAMQASHSITCRADRVLTLTELDFPGTQVELIPLPEDEPLE